MTKAQLRAMKATEEVVKILIGKVSELEERCHELEEKNARVMAHPALSIPPLSEIKA